MSNSTSSARNSTVRTCQCHIVSDCIRRPFLGVRGADKYVSQLPTQLIDRMAFPTFDLDADIAPLTELQPSTQPLGGLEFSPPLTTFHAHPPSTANGSTEGKVFFITNCGSLLGRTIAQVALERGHFVAACAREKHLADLNVLFLEWNIIDLVFGG